MTDRELAVAIAREAGALLIGVCGEDCAGRELGDRGDRRANELILDRLHEARPDDAILSEEAADDLSRLGASRVWIVDPLDGTSEYCERRDDWAVHVALAVDGVATVGAVAVPRLGRVFDGSEAVAPIDGALRILVSRSRPAPLVAAVARDLGAELVPMGSAGAKAMAVLMGEAHAYLHAGGQHEWDNCAPVAVARAAGLHASRIDGSDFVYNRRDTLVPDLLICRADVAEAMLAAIRRAG